MLTGTYREQGIYQNMSNETYHGDKNSISRSALMDFKESPYKFWANHLNPDRPQKEPTDAMIFGSAFHTFILEPGKFYEEYGIEPDKVLLKDVGRAAYDLRQALVEALENSGKKIIKSETLVVLENMREALRNNKNAMELIEGAIYEQSYFWEHKETELMLKARPDILHENMIVDLKTCSDASPKAFQRSMVAGGYHYQGAMIQDGVQALEGRFIETVINICIETTYPYSIGIYIIDSEALDFARKDYKQLLVALKDAKCQNEWPSYEIQTIGLPSWAT